MAKVKRPAGTSVPAPASGLSRTALFWTLTVFCSVAAAVRIAAARGELWLDEVWTLRLIQNSVRTPADIFFTLAHDNNHVLNTLVMYWVGPNGAVWMYRGPAVVAGIVTVVLAVWTQQRRGAVTGIAGGVLIGASYLLVQYSSEARGYAFAMLVSMLVFAILSASDASPKLRWDAAFGIACLIGILAHPLFIIVFVAAQVWTWWPDRSRVARHLWPTLLFRTALPGVFLIWWYVTVLRHITVGGGDPQPLVEVILQTLSLSIGGPFNHAGAVVAAAMAVGLTVAALRHVLHESIRRGSFYLAVIVVLPALVTLVGPREDLYPRYFLGSVFFALLLWSEYLGGIMAGVRGPQVWPAFALCAFVFANGWHIAQLISLGRGHYRDALAVMARDTRGSQIQVVVDHPARQTTMLDYYGPRAGLSKALQIGNPTTNNLHAAEWLLTHDLDVDAVPAPAITNDGVTFRLVAHYPFPGLSGWALSVYHREG